MPPKTVFMSLICLVHSALKEIFKIQIRMNGNSSIIIPKIHRIVKGNEKARRSGKEGFTSYLFSGRTLSIPSLCGLRQLKCSFAGIQVSSGFRILQKRIIRESLVDNLYQSPGRCRVQSAFDRWGTDSLIAKNRYDTSAPR